MKLCDTCATCKHWEPPLPECVHGECNGIPCTGSGGAACTDSQLIRAETGDYYPPLIYTRADFGCLLWEAKP